MDIQSRKKALFKEFAPRLETTSTVSKIYISFLIAIILVGIYAFYLQMSEGQIVTGMRDNVVWGIYEVNFILLVCISYSGAFISGIFDVGKISGRLLSIYDHTNGGF